MTLFQLVNTFLTELLETPLGPEQLPMPVPFVFADNQSSYQQWSQRAEFYSVTQQQKIAALTKALNSADLMASSKIRLEAQLAAETRHQAEMEHLLDQFQFRKSSLDIKDAVNHRVPKQQHFDSYKKNIFRDWVWGQNEISAYKKILAGLKTKNGSALIIGGGAGRLLYDLCSLSPGLKTVQLDINPLLSLVGQKICSGESVELTEIADFFVEQKKISSTYTLQAEAKLKPENFQFLIGDIGEHPFKDQAFDLVICPWLIDIIGEAFSSFSQRLNHLLKPGGELLIFGPLSFQKMSPLNRLSLEEVVECLGLNGFSETFAESLSVPYLQSPLEAQKREEQIAVTRSTKIKNSKKPKSFHYYPAWLTDTRQKPPAATPALTNLQAQKNLEAQFLGGLLSGKNIHDMADLIAKSGTGLSPEQAEAFVISIFAKMFDNEEFRFE